MSGDNKTWVQDIPVTSMRYAVREFKERLRVCSALTAYLEDIADVHNAYGKSLSKIGNQPFVSRTDILPVYSSVVEQFIRLCTSMTSRNHLGFSLTVSQNISKPLPDNSKGANGKVSAIVNRVQSLAEEFRRQRQAHQRSYERYTRTISEAEAAIRNRDMANTENDGSKDTTEKDSGFMNRSFTKVKILAKMTPEDNKKRLVERCKELMRDIETQESMLALNVSKLRGLQSELREDAVKGLVEIKDCEQYRLHLLKDSLNKLVLAEDLTLERMVDANAGVTKAVGSLHAETEIAATMAFIESAATSRDSTEDDNAVQELFQSAEKLLEVFDYIRLLLQRFCGCLLEVAEAEKGCARGLQKVLDKHGYRPAAGSGPNRQAFGRTSSISGMVSTTSGALEVLSSVEAPGTKAAWETHFRAIAAQWDLHTKTVEIFVDQLCSPLENMMSRLQSIRRDLSDKRTAAIRMVDSAAGNVTKLNAKVLKLQQFLKERKQTVRKAKEDDGYVMDPADDEIEAGSPPDRNSAVEEPSSVRGAGSIMKQSLEKMRTTKLSLVVGLESKTDRISRIEAQIINLEEEENELQAQHAACLAAADLANDNARKDIFNAVAEAKTALSRDITLLKTGIVDLFAKWINDSTSVYKTGATDVHSAMGNIDDSRDVESFVVAFSSITDSSRDAFYTNSAPDIVSAVDFSPIESFERLANEAVDEERSAISAASQRKDPVDFHAVVLAAASAAGNAPASAVESSLMSSSTTQGAVASPAASDVKIGHTPSNEPLVVQSDSPELVTSPPGDETPLSSPASPSTVTLAANLSTNQPPAAASVQVQVQSVAAATNTATGGSVPVVQGRPTSEDDVTITVTANVAGTRTSDTIGKPDKDIASVVKPAEKSAAVTAPTAPASEDYPLLKFGLVPTDRILESFSCALYPKKGIGLAHGRMYITQYFLAFQGWPETRLLLPLSSITSLEKMNTVVFIPNAILIKDDSTEYFFGSFIDRDQCFMLLKSMSDVVKRLVELHGKEQAGDYRPNLVFGLQKDSLSDMLSGTSSEAAPGASKVTESDKSSVIASEVISPAPEPLTVKSTPSTPTTKSGQTTAVTPSTNSLPQPLVLPESAANGADSLQPPPMQSVKSPVPASQVATVPSQPLTPAPKRVPVETADEEEDLVEFVPLFTKSGIAVIASGKLNALCEEMWRACWKDGVGFRDFLHSEGDLDINLGEWKPFTGTVPEDVSRLKFTYTRSCTYAHPRTTMLMFGPKNAPAKQTQFLYVFGRGSSKNASAEGESHKSIRPRRALVLTMTQFDGIPMADMFKVLQYWAFEDGRPYSKVSEVCSINIGVHVHFIKSTMLRGQVISGVKDELTVLAKKYITWARNRTDDLVMNESPDESIPDVGQVAPAEGAAATVGEEFVGEAVSVAPTPAPRKERRTRRMSEELQEPSLAVTPPPPAENSFNPVTIAVAAVFVLVVVMQWWSNRSMKARITSVEAKLDLLQKAFDLATNTAKAAKGLTEHSEL